VASVIWDTSSSWATTLWPGPEITVAISVTLRCSLSAIGTRR